MATNEYTDLTILDCNRQHSIQARSGNDENPALFTNELGKGIRLKVGDKVSVQAIYVSERGAGSDTIELKGDDTGKKRTIYYTKENFDFPTNMEQTYSNGSNALPLITGYQEIIFDNNASLTYAVKDNETYITVQYYLNNAGDSGHVSLPRRFCSNKTNEDTDMNSNQGEFNLVDKVDRGRPYHEVQAGQFVSSDFIYYDNSESNTTSGFYKLRTDCSRFTLMKREGTTKLRRETIFGDDPDDKFDNGFPPILDYISGAKYYIHKQPIKISLSSGFSSPDSISQDITRQLKEASDPVDFKVKYQGVVEPVTQYVSTETFKPQLCSSNYTMQKETYQNFSFDRDTGGDSEEKRKEDSWAYYSNFYNVYHKRPEIREAGQLLNNLWGSNIRNYNIISHEFRSIAIIRLSLEWNDTNLLNLKRFFDSQEHYPELFSNENAQQIHPPIIDTPMSVDNARYIHMNTQYNAKRSASLGGDNIDFNASAVNQRSLPAFIKFQKENKDKLTDGYDRRNLCYGFAHREDIGTNSFIVLTTAQGGLNEALFLTSENGSTYHDIPADTIIGYDHSYNAYGTACLIGYSGRLRYDYPFANEWGIGDINMWRQDPANNGTSPESLATAEYLRYQYIGSNNPRCQHDPASDKFSFSDLHTPEVSGQEWVSAGDNGSGVSPAVEDNTQNGGNIVYKINKRINPYTYTPDMRPYNFSYNASYSYGKTTAGTIERIISQPNRSIQPWAVFDSQSGIFISDFGYDKKDWDSGLWGILGFSYNQFNQTLTSTNNRLTRIINSNVNDLNIPTTNSDIVSTDTRDYIVNQFGAVYFTTQLPSSSTIKDRDFLPAITQNTESIKLTAQNIPRKMLRPYYCIRSDIIDRPHYVGGENSNDRLSVVAICDKQYSGGDFYFSSEEDFEFTITKEKTITSITTSIHDPNQTFSNVNDDSSVIYRIQSQVRNDLSVAEELLEQLKKKK